MSCVSQNTSLLSREKRYIERVNITIKDVTIDYEFRNIAHARAVINEIVRFFNEERLHSAINLLRPVDYYRGDPEKLIVERRTKLIQARHRRRMKNLKSGNIIWLSLNRKTIKTITCFKEQKEYLYRKHFILCYCDSKRITMIYN